MPTISMFYGIIISMFFAIKEVENGTVTWPGNIDIDPETLYERSVPLPCVESISR